MCGVMKPSGETNGAGGQLSKHRAHFSVSAPRQLGKHAGISVIDELMNEVTALFICIFLMHL